MPVSEFESGITSEHIQAIQEQTLRDNCFVILRPTEYDSTVLIKEGFPTKSMDIHDKSSNWGPMAGMVPLDPAFSKKRVGRPNAQIVDSLQRSGEAMAVPLRYSIKVYQSMLQRRKISLEQGYYLDNSRIGANNWQTGSIVRYLQPGTEFPEHNVLCNFCRDVNDAHNTLFCLTFYGTEVEVNWVYFPPGSQEGRLVPVFVWAYPINGEIKPVTGDYDLWMVIPYYTEAHMHCQVEQHTDAHGTSSTTGYINAMIDRLNHACNRFTNPVFRHGAEAQNLDFTQQLDKRFVIFTPGGHSYIIVWEHLAAYLKEIISCGYLVCSNPQYQRDIPALGGREWFTRNDVTEAILEIDQEYTDAIKEAAMIESIRTQARRVSEIDTEFNIRRDSVMGVHEIRQHQQRFEDLIEESTPITRLRPHDFPHDFVVFHRAEVELLHETANKISRGVPLSPRDIGRLNHRLGCAKQKLLKGYRTGELARPGTGPQPSL